MFSSEYEVRAHRHDLIRQAKQRRLVYEAIPRVSLTQNVGRQLLKWGARFSVKQGSECIAVETQRQVVSVCPAVC